MKHHRFLYRTLSALLCLGLCAQLTACGKKPVPKPGSSGPSAPSVSKKVYDDSLITEVYDEEDSFTDEYGTEYSYICHVPQLEADTPEAKAITTGRSWRASEMTCRPRWTPPNREKRPTVSTWRSHGRAIGTTAC